MNKIACDERLPKSGDRVWIWFVDNPIPQEAWFFTGCGPIYWCDDKNSWDLNRVSHWAKIESPEREEK